MFLLRETDRSVTDVCFDVGFTSLGTFSRTFREIVGETPSGYRLGHGPIVAPNWSARLLKSLPRNSSTTAASFRLTSPSRFTSILLKALAPVGSFVVSARASR